ncbi:MAG: TatD family hydrolase [Firmicutes bacterium]|jgi:TatD DNase family protein|nr:TatD family hydrolase [Candidatus Fermentithermobacillaceae bacterium]
MVAEYRETGRPAPAVFDTHAHVSARAFDKDRHEVLGRARDLGIVFLEVGFNEDSSRKALALAEEAGGFCAVGIHPHDAMADESLEARWQYIETLALQSPRVKAIGEIGLDYYRELSPKKAQADAFVMGLDLARRHRLPAIIHQRQCSWDVVSILEKHGCDIPLVFHCFSEGIDYARKCLDLGGYIGLGGPLTYPRNGYLRDMLKFLPPDRLLVETDCPWLPPQSKRGKRNEPAYIMEVIQAIAGVLGRPPAEIMKLTFDNGVRVFAIGEGEW